ncbi:Hypothetical predicted protein, partial [Marmota monax]
TNSLDMELLSRPPAAATLSTQLLPRKVSSPSSTLDSGEKRTSPYDCLLKPVISSTPGEACLGS